MVPAAVLLDPLQGWAAARQLGVEGVDSFADAARRLAGERFDLVICDARRRADQALELLEAARARGLDVPFVLITPGSADETAHRARTLGRGLCLPARLFSAEALDEVVGLVMGSRLGPPAPAPASAPASASVPAASGDLAPAMLFKIAADGAFTTFTRAWCAFTGRSEEQERGSGWIAGLDPDDVARWLEVFQTALAAQQPFAIDLRLRRADGTRRWLRVRGLPRLAHGAFAGYLGSAFDISDLREIHAALVADVERLASVNADLEQFAYAAAHDLDEPLRTLENALGAVAAAEGAEALELARASARRMRALIRDLLECMLVGASASDREQTDLSTPLDWALRNLEQRLRDTGARVTRDTLPSVRCDPIQVARAFQNLIGNALKFRSDAKPRIYVGARVTRSEVEISIRDNGVGIRAEHHEIIFEPFTRVHARPSAPAGGDPESGSGIGLALCRRIVQRHGGRIWVESEPGKGSTFRLTLKR